MSIIENVWLLEWSKSQQAVYIQPLFQAVNKAAQRFSNDQAPPNDYEAIFAGTREECDALASKVKAILLRREHEREMQ